MVFKAFNRKTIARLREELMRYANSIQRKILKNKVVH